MKEITKYQEIRTKIKAYSTLLNIVGWDSNTEAPNECFDYRSEMISVISGEAFALETSKEYKEIVDKLFEKREGLDEILRLDIEYARKDLYKILNIPKEDYVEYAKQLSLSKRAWEEAKEKSEYGLFKPYLEKIIEFKKKIIDYRGYDDVPYNTLLDDYETGMTTKDYDKFFNTIKSDLVPFVLNILKKKKPSDDFSLKIYSKDKQKEFIEYLMEVFSFNKNRGVLKESVHPFTWNTHSKDVRFTVKYLEDLVFSSIFAGVHELGHALYEQQIDESLDQTFLGKGTSMGIHESQSRFYENTIGRSYEFWHVHYPKFKEIFPKQLKDVNLNDFHKAINKVEASLIRVEADELTYPLHILLRYEIERDIFDGKISVDDLPRIWNEKMEKYLGITPKDDSEGVLQDVHWSAGLFGYFPTYALGSAYAAQFYYTMRKELDFDNLIEQNKISVITEWLKEKIHKFGSTKKPSQLLMEVTGEEFNPKYYVEYLKEKYSKLYL